MSFITQLHLRVRLVRQVFFRVIRSYYLRKYRAKISTIQYEDPNSFKYKTPCIIISNYEHASDLFMVPCAYKPAEVVYVLHTNDVHGLNTLHSKYLSLVNWNDRTLSYPLFKELIRMLRDFNRTIAVFYRSQHGMKLQEIYFKTLIKLAIRAHVPIVVQRITSSHGQNLSQQKRDLWISKKYYISPLAGDFKDLFFSKRGARQFKKTDEASLSEISRRIGEKALVYGQLIQK